MKKLNSIMKLMLILILVMTINVININVVYADNSINANAYKPSIDGNSDKVLGFGNTIIGVIQQIGSIISVITLIILGIKYMTGSVEEKAEYKKAMMPYFIGAILLFATTNILGIISKIVS